MPKKTGASRRSERELAFQFLYGLDFAPARSERELRVSFEQSAGAADKTAALSGFAWELALGVWSNARDIDAMIARFARNWRLDRMGRIELTLLRLAVYELRHRHDIPVKVTINEALELARQFGEASSLSFINGILDAAAKALEQDDKAAAASPAAQEAQQ